MGHYSSRWRADLQQLVNEDETVDDVHTRLIHTLGNLTLTAYNSPLGNRPFEQKRAEFARSGIRLNRTPAEADEWGPAQIEKRAAAIADRIISVWPGPAELPETDDSSLWRRLDEVAASIPAGHWTTYGDLAAAIGTHPVPLAQRIAGHPVPNGCRVLTSDGSVSPGFHWLDPADERDVHDVLRSEGVRFDDRLRADPEQRLSLDDLVEQSENGVDDEAWPSDVDDAIRRVRPEFRGLTKRSLFRSRLVSPSELATWVLTGDPAPEGRGEQWKAGAGPRQNDNAMDKLPPSPLTDEAIALVNDYVQRFIPWPQLTEGTYWSVSVMPRSSSLWAITVGGIYCADFAVINGQPTIRLFVARSPMLSADGASSLAAFIGEPVEVVDDAIPTAGDDQVVLRITGVDTARAMLADPSLCTAIRMYNARMVTMKNAWGASHVPALLDVGFESR